MTTKINRRAITGPRDAANKVAIESLQFAVQELGGAVGSNMQRAVRVCELVDAGILQLMPDGQLGRNTSVDQIGIIDIADVTGLQAALDGKVAKAGDTMTGSLTMSTGTRIMGDFNNATQSNRTMFQAAAINGNTSVGLIPNGSGTVTLIQAHNNSDANNAGAFQFRMEGALAVINSSHTGSGVTRDISFQFDGAEKLALTQAGELKFGTAIRQMINLYSTTYGVGVQNNTMYFRNGGSSALNSNGFAWFTGGTHSNTSYDPGAGGTLLANLDTQGNFRTTGQLISTSANAVRMVQGNYGVFWRNDGPNTYLLFTNSGDQYGSYNALRPFRAENSTGNIDMTHRVSIGGAPFGANAFEQLAVLGGIKSRGSSAQLGFRDRSNDRDWAWYASGDLVRLWNGSNDVLTSDALGNLRAATIGVTGESVYISTNSGLQVNGLMRFTSSPYQLSADSTAWVRMIRVFTQAGDPGALAADGDLWAW